MSEPYLSINLESIKYNSMLLSSKTNRECELIAIIKADAYGHGALEVCQALESINVFAVARLSEGVALKASGIKKDILVFSGINTHRELMQALEHELTVVIHTESQLDILRALPACCELNCWVKFDSGMHRLGLHIDELSRTLSALNDMPYIKVNGVLSHYSSADSDSERSLLQLDKFECAVSNIDINSSITNSAGLLQGYFREQSHARIGLSLYGVSPFSNKIGYDFGLRASQTLNAYVISVRQHCKNEPVGYDGIWISEQDTNLAVIGIGYADGYPRSAKSGTPVLIHGVEYPLVGRVSMDLICVDIGNDSEVKVGDEVVLWGGALPIEHIARCAGVIPYELLTGVSKRVNRRYFNN
ncbi:alanine racemase [Ferrimonas lipolytica]|uniref:Alanine racemase n=1 Tax=Ferrimonas lipolytica TaxID=2724191 RepID=A0A6H1UDY2_9GAMM|nr:alanine racemase [Ferrimonas lipolytica]QIZ77317.1 alanine racemase [Ferrimonas lipolytica]